MVVKSFTEFSQSCEPMKAADKRKEAHITSVMANCEVTASQLRLGKALVVFVCLV